MGRCKTQMNTMVNSPFFAGKVKSDGAPCGRTFGVLARTRRCWGTARRPRERSEVLGGGQPCTPLFQFTFPVTKGRRVGKFVSSQMVIPF